MAERGIGVGLSVCLAYSVDWMPSGAEASREREMGSGRPKAERPTAATHRQTDRPTRKRIEREREREREGKAAPVLHFHPPHFAYL